MLLLRMIFAYDVIYLFDDTGDEAAAASLEFYQAFSQYYMHFTQLYSNSYVNCVVCVVIKIIQHS